VAILADIVHSKYSFTYLLLNYLTMHCRVLVKFFYTLLHRNFAVYFIVAESNKRRIKTQTIY